MAYRVQFFQLATPSWMADAFFDIRARLPVGTTKDDVPFMLQSLLTERFNLQVHREQKERQGYTLTVAKNGPTIQRSPEPPGEAPESLFSRGKVDVDKEGFAVLPPGASTILAFRGKDGLARLTAARTSMATFCTYLGRLLQQPVVDETGLSGAYDFHLKYVPDIATPGNEGITAAEVDGDTPRALDPAPTIRMAVSTQLGLKLQSQKVMLEVLVIDHIARVPTEN